MFVVSDTSKLRVYVNVPQSFVPAIRIGTKAMISVPEYPDRSFPASIEFSSQAVDGQSGTTRMQLMVGNDEGLLLAGGYANVRIDLSRDVQTLHIPASALLFDQMACALPPSGRAKRWCSRVSKLRATLAAKSRSPRGFRPMTE